MTTKPAFRYQAALRALLMRHEGYRPYPYLDTVGKITIGVGRNLSDRGLTEAEIEMLLTYDINLAMEDLSLYLPDWQDLPSEVQLALISLSFNLGRRRLFGFKKLKHALQNQDRITAAAELLDSKWARQVGKRAGHMAGLIRGD